MLEVAETSERREQEGKPGKRGWRGRQTNSNNYNYQKGGTRGGGLRRTAVAGLRKNLILVRSKNKEHIATQRRNSNNWALQTSN